MHYASSIVEVFLFALCDTQDQFFSITGIALINRKTISSPFCFLVFLVSCCYEVLVWIQPSGGLSSVQEKSLSKSLQLKRSAIIPVPPSCILLRKQNLQVRSDFQDRIFVGMSVLIKQLDLFYKLTVASLATLD